MTQSGEEEDEEEGSDSGTATSPSQPAVPPEGKGGGRPAGLPDRVGCAFTQIGSQPLQPVLVQWQSPLLTAFPADSLNAAKWFNGFCIQLPYPCIM